MASIIDEDKALVAAAVAGSEAAWETLVEKYEPRIYNQALRLTGNAADALDLMQEVFIGVFRNLHRFRGDSQFSSWVFRIVHNKSIDLVRRWRPPVSRSRFEDDDEIASLPTKVESEPEAQYAQEHLNQSVQLLLSALPIEQRIVVELKVFQSLTFEEIAAVQDISDNTAKTRYYAALTKLKKLKSSEKSER